VVLRAQDGRGELAEDELVVAVLPLRGAEIAVDFLRGGEAEEEIAVEGIVENAAHDLFLFGFLDLDHRLGVPGDDRSLARLKAGLEGFGLVGGEAELEGQALIVAALLADVAEVAGEPRQQFRPFIWPLRLVDDAEQIIALLIGHLDVLVDDHLREAERLENLRGRDAELGAEGECHQIDHAYAVAVIPRIAPSGLTISQQRR
jgi:hypothetical protein